MRRGEECYSQKLFQRFTRTIKTIGPAGMTCTILVCNKAKHNTMGRLEYVATAPHVDPLMDQSFWHGLLWHCLIMVGGFQYSDLLIGQPYSGCLHILLSGPSHILAKNMVCFGQGFSLMQMYMLASLHTYGGDRGNKNLTKVVFLLSA
jgi:hypothetical protein